MKAKREVDMETSGFASENISLIDSIFGDRYRRELKEMNKHEIIVKIADVLGARPSDISRSEELFETIKYEITNYVIHHEYNSSDGVSPELILWLDSKNNPGNIKKLNNFISKFCKTLE